MSEKKTKRKRKSAAASIMERKTAAAGAAEGNHSDAAEALVVENADESNGTPAEPVVEEAEPSKVADTSAAIEDDQAPGPVAEAEAFEPQAEGAKVIAETDTPASETDGEQGASAEGATEPEVEAEPDPEPVPEVLLPVDAPPQPGPGNPSPDATTLAFLQPDAAGETRLWLYDLDGSGGSSIGLPFTPVIDENGPQWSPDGKWLALVGRIGGATATSIWLTPVDGGDCVLLGGHGGSDRQPCWSPDGSMIAFTSRQDDRDTICISPPNRTDRLCR